MALNRWENIWILTVKSEKDEIIFDKIMLEFAKFKYSYFKKWLKKLKEAFKRWYENLISSVENEIRWDLKAKIAQDSSISCFNKLKALNTFIPKNKKIQKYTYRSVTVLGLM